jgi:5-methylcytosine-specific restriction protein A
MCVTESPSAAAQRLLVQAAEALIQVTESGSDVELVALLSTCDTVVRRLDRVTVDAVAVLERRGVFAERGYTSVSAALSDLLGWERFEARRRVVAAEQVTSRVGLDGAVLPARLPATALVFADGRASLRHVEVIARVLGSDAAQRLSPQQWAGAEQQLAGKAELYTPRELHEWGAALVEALDQDGEEPDDRPAGGVNELHLTRLRSGGGKIKGRFDDAAMFDAIAAVVEPRPAH